LVQLGNLVLESALVASYSKIVVSAIYTPLIVAGVIELMIANLSLTSHQVLVDANKLLLVLVILIQIVILVSMVVIAIGVSRLELVKQ